MRNYIKAELYRNMNRMYFWVFTAVLAIAALSMNLLIAYTNRSGYTQISYDMLFEVAITLLSIPMYVLIAFIEMTASEEHKHLTLKNVIAGGLSREKMYIGKMITSVILASFSAAIILMVFFGSGALLVDGIGVLNISTVNNFLMRLVVAFPLWIAAMALCMMISFIITSPTAFALTYVGIISSLPVVFRILGRFLGDVFNKISDLTVMVQLEHVAKNPAIMLSNWITPVFLGIVQTILFVVLGIIFVKKTTFK